MKWLLFVGAIAIPGLVALAIAAWVVAYFNVSGAQHLLAESPTYTNLLLAIVGPLFLVRTYKFLADAITDWVHLELPSVVTVVSLPKKENKRDISMCFRVGLSAVFVAQAICTVAFAQDDIDCDAEFSEYLEFTSPNPVKRSHNDSSGWFDIKASRNHYSHGQPKVSDEVRIDFRAGFEGSVNTVFITPSFEFDTESLRSAEIIRESLDAVWYHNHASTSAAHIAYGERLKEYANGRKFLENIQGEYLQDTKTSYDVKRVSVLPLRNIEEVNAAVTNISRQFVEYLDNGCRPVIPR